MLDDFGGKLGAALRRFFRADALHACRDIGGVEGIAGGCGIERMSLIALAAPVWRVCNFCLIFVPFGHFDEPETLPYEIRLVCSIGDDVKHEPPKFGTIYRELYVRAELDSHRSSNHIIKYKEH
jgi:hypothetical protein